MCMHAQLYPLLCDPVDYIAHLAPLTKGFSRQEYWSVLLFPAPEDLPDPEIKTQVTCMSCIVRILYHHSTWELPRLKEPLDSQGVDDNMKIGLRRREMAWCKEDFQNMCRKHFANPPQRSQWERREAGDRRRKKNLVLSVFSVPLDQASVMRQSNSFSTQRESQINGSWAFIE